MRPARARQEIRVTDANAHSRRARTRYSAGLKVLVEQRETERERESTRRFTEFTSRSWMSYSTNPSNDRAECWRFGTRWW